MNISGKLETIRRKHMARQDGMDDEGWKTIKGTHVLVDETGEMSGGPERLRTWNTARKAALKVAAKVKTSKVSACKDSSSLKKCLKDVFDVSSDSTLSNWIETESGFGVVKHIFEAFETDILGEIPELEGFFSKIEVRKGCVMACCSNGTLFFNPTKIQNMDAFNEMCKRNGIPDETGVSWWPPNCTPGGILAHECGHAVVQKLWKKLYTQSGISYGKVNNEIVSEAVKRFRKTPEGKGLTIEDAIKTVSRYASSRSLKKDRSAEAIAEAFCDCYDNKDKANPFCKILKEVTLERLREV